MAKRTSQSKPVDATANETNVASKPRAAARSKATAPANSEPTGAPDQQVQPDIDPTDDEIRHRAYQRYLERGGWHGADLDDWVQAERELKARR